MKKKIEVIPQPIKQAPAKIKEPISKTALKALYNLGILKTPEERARLRQLKLKRKWKELIMKNLAFYLKISKKE